MAVFSFSLKLSFSVAAENINDFMANHFFDVFSCGFKILSGVKMIRMLDKMLTYGTGANKTKVGVDVDLANCHFCSFAKKFFGNTDLPAESRDQGLLSCVIPAGSSA